jgi:hypothetical protein
MKKIVFVLAIILFTGIVTTSYAQKNRTLSNGFSINLITGFPTGNYGLLSDDPTAIDKFGFIVGLQFGNRWYIKPGSKFGAGLMANWLDISASYKSGKESSQLDQAVVDFSLLEVGPIVTFAPTDAIALDFYYNLRPTVLATLYSYSDEVVNYVGGGVSHGLGTAFRWKALNFGLEYVFGTINSSYTGSESYYWPDNMNLKVNNVRIKIGVKF